MCGGWFFIHSLTTCYSSSNVCSSQGTRNRGPGLRACWLTFCYCMYFKTLWDDSVVLWEESNYPGHPQTCTILCVCNVCMLLCVCNVCMLLCVCNVCMLLCVCNVCMLLCVCNVCMLLCVCNVCMLLCVCNVCMLLCVCNVCMLLCVCACMCTCVRVCVMWKCVWVDIVHCLVDKMYQCFSRTTNSL